MVANCLHYDDDDDDDDEWGGNSISGVRHRYNYILVAILMD